MLIDTHCHLYFDAFDADREAVLARMAAAGVDGALVIGIEPDSNASAAALARMYPQLRYSVGLHPTSEFHSRWFRGDIEAESTFSAEAYLSQWWDNEEWHGGVRPVAVGECGIDLYWDTNSLAAMRNVFLGQLFFCRERELPVIIHTREANAETRECLEAMPGVRGVLHCFNGSPELLDYALSREGWYVSFAGNLSYPKAEDLRRYAAQIPLERLLVETDAPFMPPQALRKLKPGQAADALGIPAPQYMGAGKVRCEPVHVKHTASLLAELRGMSLDELAPVLRANSETCFGTKW